MHELVVDLERSAICFVKKVSMKSIYVRMCLFVDFLYFFPCTTLPKGDLLVNSHYKGFFEIHN